MIYIIFNRLSSNSEGYSCAMPISEKFIGQPLTFVDITTLDDVNEFIAKVTDSDKIIVCGGDGTLNKLANSLNAASLTHDIYYFPTGTGNDFFTDVKYKSEDGLVKLNDYVVDLPSVTVGGKTLRFLNGIGFGIDGYCCEEGDNIRAEDPSAAINYTSIAIGGLMGKYKPRNAVITVDGVKKSFRKVWLAPTMNGRYYGGGMMVAPDQDRLNNDGKLSLVVMHGTGKLKTLIVFPSIFKGEHVKHKEMVEVLTGHEITVTFDSPCALQVDGETFKGVTSYTAKSSKVAK